VEIKYKKGIEEMGTLCI